MLVPLTARERTCVFVKPEFTAVQLVPLSVERKTPYGSVPAMSIVPFTASDCTYMYCKPSGFAFTHWAGEMFVAIMIKAKKRIVHFMAFPFVKENVSTDYFSNNIFFVFEKRIDDPSISLATIL